MASFFPTENNVMIEILGRGLIWVPHETQPGGRRGCRDFNIREQQERKQGTEKLVIEGVMVSQLWTGRAQSPWGMWRTCGEYTPELNGSILSPHFHPPPLSLSGCSGPERAE